MQEAEAQNSYQVRFDWGHAGAAAIAADADALVWVDQLGDEPAPEVGVPVVAGTLQSAAAVAAWSLARQEQLGGRFRIAVAAAGAARDDGSLRFCVEDLLAAGAVIEHIAELGIDHQSPEAASAAAAFSGLRRATKHLVSASVSARQAPGAAIDLSAVEQVRTLRE
jgi:2-phosphosulfolactate phosphatase